MTSIPALIDELLSFPTCASGGPLHIVVDDCNVEDQWLDFCEQEAQGDHWSIVEADEHDQARIRELSLAIIAALRPLFPDERRRAVE